jgi:Lhr-like helicase
MMIRSPPHILVTTPESLYLLLTSDSRREMLKTVRSVIVDEIHALAGNKRGAHLTLSLERLNQLCEQPLVRIGISTTQKPIDEMARYLTGQHDDPVQRVGRSGHQLSGTPTARLFPLSRDDLVELVATLDAIRRDELDLIRIPQHPLDVFAQQIVSEVSAREWYEQALCRVFKCVRPYNQLAESDFLDLVKMLADGFHRRRGRRGDYLHRDAVNGILRPRRSARLTAITNAIHGRDFFGSARSGSWPCSRSAPCTRSLR